MPIVKPPLGKASKSVQITASVLATILLFASFASPLQSLEAWRFHSEAGILPPHLVTFTGQTPLYADNPKVQILAFVAADASAWQWKLSLCILAIAILTLSKLAAKKTPRERAALLSRIHARWPMLTHEERRYLIDEIRALLAFMENNLEIRDAPSQSQAPPRAVVQSHRIAGEEPHVTSERLRKAAALVENGMDEEEAVMHVWQVSIGSPRHGERLEVFQRWLYD